MHGAYSVKLINALQLGHSYSRVREMIEFSCENCDTMQHMHRAYTMWKVWTLWPLKIFIKGMQKVNLSLFTPQRHIGGLGTKLHSFLTWTLNGYQWSTSRPDGCIHGKPLRTFTVDWNSLHNIKKFTYMVIYMLYMYVCMYVCMYVRSRVQEFPA